jgi:hypothetical protein
MTNENNRILAFLVDQGTGWVWERKLIDRDIAIAENEIYRKWDQKKDTSIRLRWEDENRNIIKREA